MNNIDYRPTLLDLPISIFKTRLENLPEGVTTLRRIVSRESNAPAIEAIRAEPDKSRQKELKDQLRAVTSVARLHHRKAATSFADKIAVQWPMLAGDVDKSDNPGINMAELKNKISQLQYVLLCGYSVRGGLWFVVRLPDNQTPETLAGHFRYLQRLFSQQFGVKLDSSKGGNPTDLRFFSYDTTPYLNDAAMVMAKTYTPPKPKTRPFHQQDSNGPDGEDGRGLLTRLIRFTERAGEGNRHTTLLKAATVAGGYVAAGRLDEQTAIYGLETVASEWPSFTKSQKTIRDGIKHGQQKPLYAETWSNDYAQATHQAPHQQKQRTAPRQDAPQQPRPNNTMVIDGKLIHGEVLAVDSCDSYPPEWDEPNEPDALPTLKALTFFDWQQKNPPFNQLGLASLPAG